MPSFSPNCEIPQSPRACPKVDLSCVVLWNSAGLRGPSEGKSVNYECHVRVAGLWKGKRRWVAVKQTRLSPAALSITLWDWASMPSIHFKMSELGIPWLELGLHAFTDGAWVWSGPGTKIHKPCSVAIKEKIKGKKDEWIKPSNVGWSPWNS